MLDTGARNPCKEQKDEEGDNDIIKEFFVVHFDVLSNKEWENKIIRSETGVNCGV